MGSSSKCPVCILKPVMPILKFFTFAAYMTCPHSNPPSLPHFHKSKISSKFALFTAAFLLVQSIVYAERLSKTESISEIVRHVVTIILALATAVMVIHMVQCLREQLQHHNGHLCIFASRQQYELHDLLDLRFKRKLYWMLFSHFMPWTIPCAGLIGEKFYDYSGLTLEKISDAVLRVLIALIYVSVFTQVLLLSEIYFLYFGKCHEKIRELLHRKNLDVFSVRFLRRRLRLMQKFHMALFANFQIIKEAWDFSILLFWTSGAMICIGNLYTFISYILQRKVGGYDEVILSILCLCAVLTCISVVDKYQHLYDMNNDILSFLFQCPISKLGPLEAAQVEILISTFILQRPQMQAADIFTIETRLLASVAGTVLTYVLVGLQFQALWLKK